MNLKALVVSAALVGSVVTVGSATAADIDGCASTSTCLWDDNDYQNKVAERTHGKERINYVGDNAHNKMDSWANNSNTYQSCGYDGKNGTGDAQDWEENQHDDNVAPWNSDEVSSWRTKFGC